MLREMIVIVQKVFLSNLRVICKVYFKCVKIDYQLVIRKIIFVFKLYLKKNENLNLYVYDFCD